MEFAGSAGTVGGHTQMVWIAITALSVLVELVIAFVAASMYGRCPDRPDALRRHTRRRSMAGMVRRQGSDLEISQLSPELLLTLHSYTGIDVPTAV